MPNLKKKKCLPFLPFSSPLNNSLMLNIHLPKVLGRSDELFLDHPASLNLFSCKLVFRFVKIHSFTFKIKDVIFMCTCIKTLF